MRNSSTLRSSEVMLILRKRLARYKSGASKKCGLNSDEKDRSTHPVALHSSYEITLDLEHSCAQEKDS